MAGKRSWKGFIANVFSSLHCTMPGNRTLMNMLLKSRFLQGQGPWARRFFSRCPHWVIEVLKDGSELTRSHMGIGWEIATILLKYDTSEIGSPTTGQVRPRIGISLAHASVINFLQCRAAILAARKARRYTAGTLRHNCMLAVSCLLRRL